jgi:hypothetical protein
MPDPYGQVLIINSAYILLTFNFTDTTPCAADTAARVQTAGPAWPLLYSGMRNSMHMLTTNLIQYYARSVRIGTYNKFSIHTLNAHFHWSCSALSGHGRASTDSGFSLTASLLRHAYKYFLLAIYLRKHIAGYSFDRYHWASKILYCKLY